MDDSKKRLQKILQEETHRLRSSYPSNKVIFPVIEIIRSLDYNHFILSHHSDLKSSQILEKFKFGWSKVFSLFYSELDLQSNAPLFIYNNRNRNWIDSIIQHSGHISLCEQFLDYCKAVLMSLENHENSFKFKLLSKGISSEYYERMSLGFYHSAMEGILSDKIAPFMQQLPEMRKGLENIVSIVHENFIQYKATPEIDQFYSSLGYFQLMTNHVIDDFGETDLFGGVEYRKYLDFCQDLLKAIIMHRNFCMAAEIKTSYGIFLRDILSYAFSKSSFVDNYSEYSGWTKDDVNLIVSCFTLDQKNLNYHLSYPSASAPPYILIGDDTLLRSAYGAIDRPVFFLNRELKRRFPKDYFNAVNNREKRFRDQIYSFFPEHRIVKVEENINIKSGKLVTDIDAVLYDKERKILGIFQLKWQDSFSFSMKERFSRISNLMPKSVEWIDKVSAWISNNNAKTISKTLKLDYDIDQFEDIYLFVISRNHAHFTNVKLDNRAVWASWYQFVEAFAKIKDPFNSNPIGELAAKLHFTRPGNRHNFEKLPELKDTNFKFSKYEVSVNFRK